MSQDLSILRVMLRMAEQRRPADLGVLEANVVATDVEAALRRLDAMGLIERRPTRPPRLTMAGLAVAVATSRRAKGGGRRGRPHDILPRQAIAG